MDLMFLAGALLGSQGYSSQWQENTKRIMTYSSHDNIPHWKLPSDLSRASGTVNLGPAPLRIISRQHWAAIPGTLSQSHRASLLFLVFARKKEKERKDIYGI